MRFPEFTGEWVKCKLGEIMSYSKDRVSTNSLSDENYVSTENMLPNFGGICRANNVPSNNSAIVYHTRNILLSNIRPYLKKVWLANNNGGCSSDVFVLKADNEQCDSDFLFYLVANDNFISYVMSGAKGVKMPRGDKEQIKKYLLSLPLKDEQHKIAEFLCKLDARISTQIRVIEDLQSLKKAITNFIIDKLIKAIPLTQFAEIYIKAGEGGTPDTTKHEYYKEGTIPFIKIDDLCNKYLTEHKDNITELGLQKSSAWVVPAKSLIYSNGATIGAISINTYPVATKQGILGIVPKQNVDVEYLYYLMTSTYFNKQVHRIIIHGTMATAYLKDINKIKVSIPTLQEQQSITKLLSAISKKEEMEHSLLSHLNTQKQYLLQQMFI